MFELGSCILNMCFIDSTITPVFSDSKKKRYLVPKTERSQSLKAKMMITLKKNWSREDLFKFQEVRKSPLEDRGVLGRFRGVLGFDFPTKQSHRTYGDVYTHKERYA